MKKALILILLTASAAIGFSQTPYYDAFTLAQYYDNSSGKFDPAHNEDVSAVLQTYLVSPLPANTVSAVLFKFTANPLIGPWIDRSGGAGLRVPPFLSVAMQAFGDADVTRLADGVTKFIVKRTKQELNAAFFDHLKQLLNKKEFEDAAVLFPQTVRTIAVIGEDIYNYGVYLQALREAFETDLLSLIPHLQEVINSPKYNDPGKHFTVHPALKSICLSVLDLANGLVNGDNAGKILGEFDLSNLDGIDSTSNIKPAVHTLQLFSESIRSNGTDHYWLSVDSLKLLFKNPIAFRIYLGLVYEQAEGVNFFLTGPSTLSLQSVLGSATAPGPVADVKNYITGLLHKTADVTNRIKALSGVAEEKTNFVKYYSLYASCIDFFEFSAQIGRLPGLKALTPGPEFQKFIGSARIGGNIALDVNRTNYTSALINASQLYSTAFEGTNTEMKKFLLKYGTFMAAVAEAKTSDEVSDAIEAAALPAGSSRIKRETAFNVALNAYAGLYLGSEKIQGIGNKHFLNSFGVSAPIGISISKGHSIFFVSTGDEGWKKNTKGWSTSLFISLVDLGAVAAFRFKDDTTSQVPTIQLKNLFSPGAFLSLGIPKTPLSVNFGAQIGPNLRSIDRNNATLASTDNNNKLYARYSVSLLVDIPLLNFSSKTYYPKDDKK